MEIIIPSSKIYSMDYSNIVDNQAKSVSFTVNDIQREKSTKIFEETQTISDFDSVSFKSEDLIADYQMNNPKIVKDGDVYWLSWAKIRPFYKKIHFTIDKIYNGASVISETIKTNSTRIGTCKTYDVFGEYKYAIYSSGGFTSYVTMTQVSKNDSPSYTTEQSLFPKVVKADYASSSNNYPDGEETQISDIVTVSLAENRTFYNVDIDILYAFSVFTFYDNPVIPNTIGTRDFNATIRDYVADSVDFEVLGSVYTLNTADNTITLKGENDYGIDIVLQSNNLMQSKYEKFFEQYAKKTLGLYQNGREYATIRCSIGDYYDTLGDKVISTESADKMTFNLYDTVVPMVRNQYGFDSPISRTIDGYSKVFSVLGSKIFFDGAVWQELTLQECGYTDITDGTPSLTYEISEDKTYAICTGIKDSEIKILDIATNVNGIIVQEIGVEAFRKGYDQSSIPNVAKVNIPNTVLSIGSRAFQYLNIPKIKLPSNLVSIGSGAFNVNSLTQIDIPNSTTFIGSSAFASCNNLTKVSLGENLKNIEEGAFGLCYKMTDICFNAIEMNDVTSSARIFSSSGRSANGINVIIGQKVKRIPAYLFYTDVLNQIYLPPKISNVKFEENSVCKSIGEGAFSHIDNSFEIEIPPSIEFIGSDAFYNSYVDKVHIKDIANWCNINFASPSANPIYQSANIYINNEIVEDLVIPNTVTEIKPYSFIMCGSLSSVLIPNSVKIIGDYAFDECYGLYSVYYMGSDVDWANISIGGSNSGLTNAIIYYYSETEPSDEGHYWHYVNGEITVWGSENSVAMYSRIAPKQTPNRYTTEEGFGVEEYDYTAILYRYKGGESNLVLPRYLNYKQYQIGDFAFAENHTIEAISIPTSVTYIGESAFENCANLKDVYYEGTRSQWNNIYVGNGNEALLTANIHFNSFIS